MSFGFVVNNAGIYQNKKEIEALKTNKLDKLDNTNIIYINDSNGDQTSINYTSSPEANIIPIRDGNGNILSINNEPYVSLKEITDGYTTNSVKGDLNSKFEGTVAGVLSATKLNNKLIKIIGSVKVESNVINDEEGAPIDNFQLITSDTLKDLIPSLNFEIISNSNTPNGFWTPIPTSDTTNLTSSDTLMGYGTYCTINGTADNWGLELGRLFKESGSNAFQIGGWSLNILSNYYINFEMYLTLN